MVYHYIKLVIKKTIEVFEEMLNLDKEDHSVSFYKYISRSSVLFDKLVDRKIVRQTSVGKINRNIT